MKYFLILISFIFLVELLPAQHYQPVDEGSSVKFVIKNFGLNVDGSLKGLKGTINFDPAHLAEAEFKVSVNTASISTGNGSRDNHLKKEDYFDVAKYPTINFASTRIIASGTAGHYTVEGMFTIKGVSKSISFPFVVFPGGNGNQFTGQFKINRRDFKVGGKSWVLSDDVSVTLNVTTVKL